MRHTPGPWLTDWKRGHRVFVEYEADDEIDRELIARVSGPQANAQLIAAAPDMLGALKNLVHKISNHQTYDLRAANAAIKKAEGSHE